MKNKNKEYLNNKEFAKHYEEVLRIYHSQVLSQLIKRGIADKRRRLEQLKIEQK